jgi:serine protease Do
MRRSITVPLWGVTLVAGIVVGLIAAAIPWSSTVHADPAASGPDRIDAELGGDRNPLAESSRVLARIAALTSPSVVHIQSERRNERRGIVEETGSGALIAHPKQPGLLVVTNRHVLVAPTTNDDHIDMKSVRVQVSDGRVVNPTRMWSDRATDLAVMQLPDLAGLHPLRLGDSDNVEIGHLSSWAAKGLSSIRTSCRPTPRSIPATAAAR